MALHIVELHDASEALDRARGFLVTEPAHHNLLLTILETSIEFSLGGAFWLVVDDTDVVGFGLESPPGMGAVLARMPAPIGRLRLAERADRPTLVEWTIAFGGETETIATHAEQIVDLAVAREQLWVWDDGGPVSMSGASNAAAGVARVQRVYTPPEHRGRGYATACVEHQSRLLAERGLGCVLYTQLSNPTSNAIYQRIGYQPIAETLVYRFA